MLHAESAPYCSCGSLRPVCIHTHFLTSDFDFHHLPSTTFCSPRARTGLSPYDLLLLPPAVPHSLLPAFCYLSPAWRPCGLGLACCCTPLPVGLALSFSTLSCHRPSVAWTSSSPFGLALYLARGLTWRLSCLGLPHAVLDSLFLPGLTWRFSGLTGRLHASQSAGCTFLFSSPFSVRTLYCPADFKPL